MKNPHLSFTAPDGSVYVSAPIPPGVRYKCPCCALYHRRDRKGCPHFGAHEFPEEPDCLSYNPTVDIVWVQTQPVRPDPNPL